MISYIADLLKYGVVYVGTCQNNTDSGIVWQDKSVIDGIVDTILVKVSMINTNFDSNDFDDPIHTYIDQRVEYGIAGFSRTMNMYIRENEANLQDNYLALSSEVKRKFIEVNIDNDRNTDDSDEHFVIWSFYKSYQRKFIDRKVSTIFDVLGSLGGLFELL